MRVSSLLLPHKSQGSNSHCQAGGKCLFLLSYAPLALITPILTICVQTFPYFGADSAYAIVSCHFSLPYLYLNNVEHVLRVVHTVVTDNMLQKYYYL